VCALYKPGVEKPSDLDGVLYVEMDDSSAWQRGLAREMHHAELSFDLAAALA
jgi:predicted nucleotide-binding protein